jgi:hypothetical protein
MEEVEAEYLTEVSKNRCPESEDVPKVFEDLDGEGGGKKWKPRT